MRGHEFAWCSRERYCTALSFEFGESSVDKPSPLKKIIYELYRLCGSSHSEHEMFV